MNPYSESITKIIRTVAQAIGGVILLTLSRYIGVDIDDGTLQAVLLPILVGVWIVLVDLLVKYVHPGFEILNIIKKTPVYNTPAALEG